MPDFGDAQICSLLVCGISLWDVRCSLALHGTQTSRREAAVLCAAWCGSTQSSFWLRA